MNRFLFKVIVFSGLSVFPFVSCGPGEEEIPETYGIEFGKSAYTILENGNIQLKIRKVISGAVKTDTIWYNTISNPDGLVWKASDEAVIQVDQKGAVTAKKTGSSKVNITSPDRKLSAETNVKVVRGYSVKQLESGLSDNITFSKGIYLLRNSVMQSFDIGSGGMIFYDQLGGSLPQFIYVIRAEANKNHTDYMQLKYFGHGTNLVVEEEGNDAYIWIASNGTKGSDGEYGSSQTVSRVKYDPGAIWENYSDETYYLKNKYNVHPAIDVSNDMLAVTTSGGSDSKRYFYFFKLSEAKALPYTSVTLSSVKFGGEGDGTIEQTVIRTVQVKNLSWLTPLGSFGIGPGESNEQLNFYSFQGFDIAEGYLYFLEGEGNDNTGVLPSNAYVTVLDINGNIIFGRTSVKAISNISELSNFGITATGYMEAEGIKVKNGVLYLGFASRSTDNLRRANVLRYKLHE